VLPVILFVLAGQTQMQLHRLLQPLEYRQRMLGLILSQAFQEHKVKAQ
jgi:hypothetical protein